MTDKDKEREAFEAFAKTDTSNVSLERDGDGYVDMAAALVWHGFQAGRASLSLPAAGQEPMFWVRLFGDGLYEGPLHNNSFGGKLARKERPGEWSPLYLGAAPQPAVAAGWVMVPASVIESAITALDWMPTSDAARHLWDRQQPVLALLRSSIPPAPSTEGEKA